MAETAAAGAAYPLEVEYCPVCGLPPEYCQYGPKFQQCLPWLREHHPEILEQDDVAEVAERVERLSVADKKGEGTGAAEGGAGGAAEAEAGAGAGASTDAKPDKGQGSGKGKASVIEQQMVFLVIRDTKKPGKKGKKKVMTGVLGVDKFGVKPKDAASALGRALGSGCTVTKTPKGQAEVQVQGDFMDRIPPVLRDVLKIPPEKIMFVEGKRARPAFG